MSKTSLDLTIVYVSTEDTFVEVSQSEIMSKLMQNQLVYYGEVVSGTRPIIYLCDKGYEPSKPEKES